MAAPMTTRTKSTQRAIPTGISLRRLNAAIAVGAATTLIAAPDARRRAAGPHRWAPKLTLGSTAT